MTDNDPAKDLYPNLTFDCTLPQDWVDIHIKEGFDPRHRVVWGYPKGFIFGLPFPLTPEAEQFLKALNPSWARVWEANKAKTP